MGMSGWIVNDYRSMIPGSVTLWDHLLEWLPGAEWKGGVPFTRLAAHIELLDEQLPDYIVRNASYFRRLGTEATPTIALLQDIFPAGHDRGWQVDVCRHAALTVFNSEYTRVQYPELAGVPYRIIPLPVDFDLFRPMLEYAKRWDVCWVGARSHVKGWDILKALVATSPHTFCVMLKDESFDPTELSDNAQVFNRVSQAELVELINQCRVGLCTSRVETQHLAGIEMGACGLPMVAPPVGCYMGLDYPGARHERTDVPVGVLAQVIRALMEATAGYAPDAVSAFWRARFSIESCRASWLAAVAELTDD